jgi:4-hydroxybenzoate polyprenyltransferase
MPAAIRLIHPAPAAAVVALSAALAFILGSETGAMPTARILLTVLAVAGSQVATGAVNDWADRERDRVARPEKPIPSGELSPRTALGVASIGLVVQVAASVPLGVWATLAGLLALGSALAYDLWLSRTPFSVPCEHAT